MSAKPKQEKKKTTNQAVNERKIEALMDQVAALVESNTLLEKDLDKAHRAQDAMLDEVTKIAGMINFHVRRVEETTGSILTEDVEYCTNLAKRIMDHKFGFKEAGN